MVAVDWDLFEYRKKKSLHLTGDDWDQKAVSGHGRKGCRSFSPIGEAVCGYGLKRFSVSGLAVGFLLLLSVRDGQHSYFGLLRSDR